MGTLDQRLGLRPDKQGIQNDHTEEQGLITQNHTEMESAHHGSLACVLLCFPCRWTLIQERVRFLPHYMLPAPRVPISASRQHHFHFQSKSQSSFFSFLATAVIGGFTRTTENQTEQAWKSHEKLIFYVCQYLGFRGLVKGLLALHFWLPVIECFVPYPRAPKSRRGHIRHRAELAGRAGAYRTRLRPLSREPGPTSQPLQPLFPPSPPHHQQQHEEQQHADQDAGDGH